jgi:hypothetical protein
LPYGTSTPLRPLVISCAAAAYLNATTGKPLAIASGVTLPKVSVRLGNRNRSAEA